MRMGSERDLMHGSFCGCIVVGDIDQRAPWSEQSLRQM